MSAIAILVIALLVVGVGWLALNQTKLGEALRSKASAVDDELAKEIRDAKGKALSQVGDVNGKIKKWNDRLIGIRTDKLVTQKALTRWTAKLQEAQRKAQLAAASSSPNREALVRLAAADEIAAQTKVNELQGQSDQLTKSEGQIDASIKSMTSQRDTLNNKVQSIEGRVQAAQTRKEQLELLQELGKDMDGSGDDVAEKWVDELEAKVQAMEQTEGDSSSDHELRTELNSLGSETHNDVDALTQRYLQAATRLSTPSATASGDQTSMSANSAEASNTASQQ